MTPVPRFNWKPLLAVLLLSTTMSALAADSGNEPRRYYYEDIERFFAAYDSYLESGDAYAFSTYLDQGTSGLRNFENHFGLTAETLAERVQKYPAFFGSIRDVADVLQAREKDMDAMFGRLQALFPGYEMPSVYFVIGGLRAGGQAGDGNYVMVAAELYTRMPGVDMSELRPSARTFTPDDVVHIVAHEAAHIIQEEIQGTERYLSIYTDDSAGTLMAYSLREGAANLVAQLVSGGHINAAAEAYGVGHQDELWPLFRDQAMNTDLGDWFFYQPREHPEWPRDLGYWMGYRMALNCYQSAEDKQATLMWILEASDPGQFLQECGL